MSDIWAPDCAVQDYPRKPPFSYYGGKQRLAAKICKLMPPHTVYVEPYCGSAAVMFKKGLPLPLGNSNYYREVINDTNGHVVNFFRVMQDRDLRMTLIERLNWTVYSRDEYKASQKILRTNDSSDVLGLAWAWYVNINWGYANNAGAGLRTSVISANNASSHFSAVDRLNLYRDRFRYTTILNDPAIEIVKRFDSPQSLHYVDPPYPNAHQGHYKGFTQADFEELISVLDNCQGAVLLSCYNNPAVPDNWTKHEFPVFASSKKSITESLDESYKRTECVWYKPASVPMSPVLVKAAQKNYDQLEARAREVSGRE